MADANLTVGVEVALSVDENTAVWLESLGWVRPGAPSSEAVQTEPDEEDDDWDPAEMMAGVTLSGLASEPTAFDAPCGHMEAGTPCDWDVCFQPAVQCTSEFAEGAERMVQCKRAQGHKGIHATGKHGIQWQPGDARELVPAPKRGHAMGGAEAMRYRAARIRADLMNEVSSPERVDEMLRNLDVNVEALAAVDCDC